MNRSNTSWSKTTKSSLLTGRSAVVSSLRFSHITNRELKYYTILYKAITSLDPFCGTGIFQSVSHFGLTASILMDWASTSGCFDVSCVLPPDRKIFWGWRGRTGAFTVFDKTWNFPLPALPFDAFEFS